MRNLSSKGWEGCKRSLFKRWRELFQEMSLIARNAHTWLLRPYCFLSLPGQLSISSWMYVNDFVAGLQSKLRAKDASFQPSSDLTAITTGCQQPWMLPNERLYRSTYPSVWHRGSSSAMLCLVLWTALHLLQPYLEPEL